MVYENLNKFFEEFEKLNAISGIAYKELKEMQNVIPKLEREITLGREKRYELQKEIDKLKKEG
jgi:hypothetical protein